MASEHQLARARGREDAALEPFQILRRDAEIFGGLVDLDQSLGDERLALVQGENAAELCAPALDRLGDAMQSLRALETLQRGHRLSCAVGGLDGLLCVGPSSLLDPGDRLSGRGTDGIEKLAAFGVDPLAVDEHHLHRTGHVDSHLVFSIVGLWFDPSSKARA